MEPRRLSAVERIWKALADDPAVGPAARQLTVTLDREKLVLEGELTDVASQRRVVELARAQPGLARVIDRTVVTAPVPMGDGELRDLYERALLGEPAFGELRIVVETGGVEHCLRDPSPRRGSIVATIVSGVVTLEGNIPSRAHARLAAVLAWWIPGTRAVHDEFRVDPPEEDTDDAVTDAVRIALEKEPLLDAAQIGVFTRGRRVTLSGTLPTEEQRTLAERDAWYVTGVADVVDRIQIAP